MRKTLVILTLAVTMLLPAACDNDDYDKSPEAVVTSFNIGDFLVYYKDINIQGHDTIVTRKVTGSTVPFTIDQQKNLIYNQDSLPKGSRMDSVTTSIFATGTVKYRKVRPDGTATDTLWSSKNAMDLRNPVTVKVISNDDSYVREYILKVNVHKIDPDSMTWNKLPGALPERLTEMRAVVCGSQISVIGLNADGIPCVICHDIDENGGWTPAVRCQGFDNIPDCKSLTLHSDKYFILDGTGLKYSNDCRIWSASDQNIPLRQIIPFLQTGDKGTAWAVTTDNWLAYSTDMQTWTKTQELPSAFPDCDISGFCYPLKTNKSILRYIIVGTDLDNYPSNSVIWTRLSSEDLWTMVEVSDDHSLKCPAFDNLSVIRYDEDLYAFGGEGILGDNVIEALSGFYQSSDNGITWRDCTAFFDSFNTWNRYMQIPEELHGCTSQFCQVIDGHNRIWIITSGEQGVWRGFINRLYK